MILAYCPACREPLDAENRCWSVCDLAGIAQPPIHLAEFVVDTYDVCDGTGRIVHTYTVRRMVSAP